MGATATGSADRQPTSIVPGSQAVIPASTRGVRNTASSAARFAASVTSASLPPATKSLTSRGSSPAAACSASRTDNRGSAIRETSFSGLRACLRARLRTGQFTSTAIVPAPPGLVYGPPGRRGLVLRGFANLPVALSQPGSWRAEGLAQAGRGVPHRLPGYVENPDHGEERVRHAVVAADFDGDARVRQPGRVPLALVPERVVLGCDHRGWRQPAQVRCPQRRGQRVSAVLR